MLLFWGGAFLNVFFLRLTLKGTVAVAGGEVEEEDLPVVSFSPRERERGGRQVVSPFNVLRLLISTCRFEKRRVRPHETT